jgi:hypothetical protein
MMRKKTYSFGLVLIFLFALTNAASAAGPVDTQNLSATTAVGPFEGTFYGFVNGDKDSKAPLILELTHRGDEVMGTVGLGEGLYVDAGICGATYLPSVEQYANGMTKPGNQNQLLTHLGFNVSNINVAVDLAGEISADGKSIIAEANIDLPWICGRDPELYGTFSRIE